MLLFLVSNLLHFTLGVWMFGGAISLKEVFFNPVNLATILGLAVNFMQIPVPELVLLPLSMLGQVVIPFMLFALGARMTSIQGSHLGIGSVTAVTRPVFGLIAGS